MPGTPTPALTTDERGDPRGAICDIGAVQDQPAVNTAAPGITGTGQVGQTLTCSQGSWTGDLLTFGYQWLRGGSAIGGANQPTYTTVSADGGQQLTCQVTANAPGGNASSTSAAIGVAAPVTPPPPPPPTPTLVASLQSASTLGSVLTVTVSCTGGATGAICSGPITVTGQGKSSKTTVASGTYSVASGKSVTATLKLNKAGLKLLDTPTKSSSTSYKLPATVTIGGTTALTKNVTYSLGRINPFISFTWAFTPHFSTAQQLGVSQIPSKGSVEVICHGGGCPFSKHSFTPKGGSVNLEKKFKKHHMKPKATIEIVVSAPNDVAKIGLITIRAGAQPKFKTLCQPPGVSKPASCS